MFNAITVRGKAGSLTWGYRVTAALPAWTVSRRLNEATGLWVWTLSGTLAHCDRFQVRQAAGRHELLLTAPRAGGFWLWPIREISIGEHSITATLGPPQH